MAKFYFTYGSSGQPYHGGWTEIDAQDRHTACAAFRAFHPDVAPGLLNCSDVYTEEAFAKTEMNGPSGNLGYGCHETITIQREIKGEGRRS